MKPRPEVQEYWRNPHRNNGPDTYLLASRMPQTYYMLQVMEKMQVDKKAEILELGCNSGRNLAHLYQAGWTNVQGIEINPNAVQLLHSKFPFLKGHVQVGTMEDLLPKHKPVDVIFTMAVLIHLHPESEFVLKEIVKKVRKYVFTFEDEVKMGGRHNARKYKDVFEGLGMHQIFHSPVVPGMPTMYYCARGFEK